MAGRPKYYSEEELLDKAIKVFWEKGYNSASAKDLMKAMDIGQGSFYNNFKGKKDLYRKSLLRAWGLYQKQFGEGLKKFDNPLDFLRVFMRSTVNRSEEETQRGCFAGNTLVESSCMDEELQQLATELLLEFQKAIKRILIEAQRKGMLDKSKSPDAIAKFFVNFWNGINVTLRMNNVPKKEIEEMIELNLSVLD